LRADADRENQRRKRAGLLPPVYVFPSPLGKNAAWLGLHNPWPTIRKDTVLPDMRLHDLRHSFASVLASSGASPPTIGRLLGHTQPGTTERYAHLTNEALSEATEKAGRAIVIPS
jgi:integrase